MSSSHLLLPILRDSPPSGGVFVLRRPHEAVLSSAKIFVGWSGPRPGFASFDHSASTPLLPAPDGRSWFCRFSPSAGLCGSAAASSASSTCGRKWALPSRCWTLFAASSSSSSHSPVPGVLHRRLAPGSRDSLRRGGGSAAEGGGHSGGLPFSSRLLCALFFSCQSRLVGVPSSTSDDQHPLHRLRPLPLGCVERCVSPSPAGGLDRLHRP